jgi:membrane protease YdiL (CAAX protease family)
MSRERVPLAVAAVAASLIVGLAISSASIVADDALLALCASSLTVELWIATAALVGALFVRAPLRGTLGLHPGHLTGRDLALLVLGTLAASHALDGALELSGRAGESILGELPRMLEGTRGARLAVALLALAIAPGIAEELLCRGLIQRGLTRRLGPLLAVPIAAAIFGALHVELIHAAFATLLGLYLGVAAHWAGNTRAPMLCHTINNLAAVALSAGGGSASAASPTSCIAGAGLAISCLWAVGRARSRKVSPGARLRTDLQSNPQSDDR